MKASGPEPDASPAWLAGWTGCGKKDEQGIDVKTKDGEFMGTLWALQATLSLGPTFPHLLD